MNTTTISPEGTSKAPHALYRFFNASDVLLYIGLTADIGARFKDHRREKPWWTEIARITIEHFPDRLSVINAEREAIKTERPRHNLIHNGARTGTIESTLGERPTRFGIEVGFIVALITDLPMNIKGWVGEVQAIDDLGVRITLIDWIIGAFCGEDLFVSWPHVLGAAVWTEEHTIRDSDQLGRWQRRINNEPLDGEGS